jgi:hypothetical protein
MPVRNSIISKIIISAGALVVICVRLLWPDRSEADHLASFLRFIERNGLVEGVGKKDWALFARTYNGPAYCDNQYAAKLAVAYGKYS